MGPSGVSCTDRMMFHVMRRCSYLQCISMALAKPTVAAECHQPRNGGSHLRSTALSHSRYATFSYLSRKEDADRREHLALHSSLRCLVAPLLPAPEHRPAASWSVPLPAKNDVLHAACNCELCLLSCRQEEAAQYWRWERAKLGCVIQRFCSEVVWSVRPLKETCIARF